MTESSDILVQQIFEVFLSIKSNDYLQIASGNSDIIDTFIIKHIIESIFIKILNDNGYPSKLGYEIIQLFEFDNACIRTEKAALQYITNEINAILSAYPLIISERMDNTKAMSPGILGLVFENSLSIISNPSDKSKRAITGSFYTPKPVVSDMVKSALSDVLITRFTDIDKGHLSNLVYNQMPGISLSQSQKLAILNDILSLKVLDPACGAGEFLINTMYQMVDIIKCLDDDFEHKKLQYLKHIIQNALYGIDIQPLALEITHMRLYLSILSDDPELAPSDFHELVNGTHLICDNALYFCAGNSFNDAEKFDIVITNPPYGVHMPPADKKFYAKHYSSLLKGYDIYMAFFALAIKLSRCCVCFLTPDKWLSNRYAIDFRQKVCMRDLYRLIYLGHDIFKKARVDAIISLFNVHRESSDLHFDKYDTSQQIKSIRLINKSSIQNPYYFDKYFLDASHLTHVFERFSHRLGEYIICDYAFADPHAAYQLKPLIESDAANADSDKFLKILTTGLINKYHHRWQSKPMRYLKTIYTAPCVSREKLISVFGQMAVSRLSSPKLIVKGLNLLDACLDLNGEYLSTAGTLNIRAQSDKILKITAAILNSSIVYQYFKSLYLSSSWNGALRFSPEMILNLPVPDLHEPSKYCDICQDVDDIMNTSDTHRLQQSCQLLDDKIESLFCG